MGRIGLDYYRKDPKIVFAVVDCARIGMGPPPNPVYLGIVSNNGEGGAKLSRITKDSPAEKAGIKDGDLVTAADKKPVKNAEDLTKAILAHKPGDNLDLAVKRDKETLTITVVLGKRLEPVHVGLGGEDVNEGVKVIQITPKGPAE